mgnify:CR=1 FL=1
MDPHTTEYYGRWNFVSQNIKACIQKSDIHVANNGMYGNSNYHELYGQIIKYISLIQHPGLITPSLDEKMMQVAHTAKLNSACLSRQVGASITNKFGSLKSIGWNSTADKQTPCLLRNRDELLGNSNSKSYSVFEKSNIFKKSRALSSALFSSLQYFGSLKVAVTTEYFRLLSRASLTLSRTERFLNNLIF